MVEQKLAFSWCSGLCAKLNLFLRKIALLSVFCLYYNSAGVTFKKRRVSDVSGSGAWCVRTTHEQLQIFWRRENRQFKRGRVGYFDVGCSAKHI